MENSPKYLTEKQVAEMTGIAVSTLRNHRFERRGIQYFKIFKRSIRYKMTDVIDYVESTRIDPEEVIK